MPDEVLDVRIYLCSTCSDARAEKEILASAVLPELRRRALSFGVQVTMVDPETFLPDERTLAHRLRAIESCRPFFLCILGDTCGPLLGAVPGDLAAEYPWLMSSAGFSVAEAEILFALQDPERARACFFHTYPQEGHADPSSEDGARLAALKERILSTGRPIGSGQPGVDLFARRVIEDLWQAIVREVVEVRFAMSQPDENKRGRLPSQPVPILHDNVQFTVYRPRSVAPQEWYSLLAFAHLGDLPPELRGRERDPIERVRERAEKALGDHLRDYASVTQDSLHSLPEEGEVTFLLELPGFRVNPPRATFLWLESVHLEEFRICAGTDLDGRTVRGRLSVFWGSILLADLPLGIRVGLHATSAREAPPAEAVAVQPFRNIFASYSRRDQVIVEQFERFAEALGDRYLRDVTHLRAGEVWDDRLCEFIDQAHVFQLFWSSNAMRSPFVEREWRYAISLGREHFVRPVYWEEPLPSSPELGLPPKELTRLHFQLLQGGSGAHPPLVRKGAPLEEAPPPAAPAAAGQSAPTAPVRVEAPGRRASRWLPGLAGMFIAVVGIVVVLNRQIPSAPRVAIEAPAPVNAVEAPTPEPARSPELSVEPQPRLSLPTPTPSSAEHSLPQATPRPEPPPVREAPRESAPAPESRAPSAPQPAPMPAPSAPRPAPMPAPQPSPVRVRLGDLVERGPGVIGPDLVEIPFVRYPPEAREMRREAAVSVRLLVDENGKVLQAVTEGERVGFGFEEEALAAARRASFSSPTIDGTRVKMWTTLVFEFTP